MSWVVELNAQGTWGRSGNAGLAGEEFDTAETAIARTRECGSSGCTYRARNKETGQVSQVFQVAFQDNRPSPRTKTCQCNKCGG